MHLKQKCLIAKIIKDMIIFHFHSLNYYHRKTKHVVVKFKVTNPIIAMTH